MVDMQEKNTAEVLDLQDIPKNAVLQLRDTNNSQIGFKTYLIGVSFYLVL